MATATLQVTGMTCGHCVKAVTQALESVAGVRQAKVELGAGRATVEYDENRTSPAVLVSAVTGEGYAAEET
jgi:copper chaperone